MSQGVAAEQDQQRCRRRDSFHANHPSGFKLAIDVKRYIIRRQAILLGSSQRQHKNFRSTSAFACGVTGTDRVLRVVPYSQNHHGIGVNYEDDPMSWMRSNTECQLSHACDWEFCFGHNRTSFRHSLERPDSKLDFLVPAFCLFFGSVLRPPSERFVDVGGCRFRDFDFEHGSYWPILCF
jgi:hypothetical protein